MPKKTPAHRPGTAFPRRLFLSKNAGVLILPALILLMLCAGLAPLDFRAPNGAGWVEGDNGVQFAGRGIITGGNGVSPLEDYAPGTTPLSLELVLKPSALPDSSLSHVLSLADGKGRERLFLGQWKGALIFREVDHAGLLAGVRTLIGSPEILDPSRVTVFTMVSAGGRTTLYADGKEVYRRSDLDLSLTMAGAPVGRIALGNRPEGDDPWEGELYGFSLVAREFGPEEIRRRVDSWKNRKGQDHLADGAALLYLFNEGRGNTARNSGSVSGWDLDIPAVFLPLKRQVLALPPREALAAGWFYTDAAANLAGFIPLGFLLSAFLSQRRKPSWKVILFQIILAGTALSLAIELSQVYLPSRDSSLTDLVLNTAGGALGFILFRRFALPIWGGSLTTSTQRATKVAPSGRNR